MRVSSQRVRPIDVMHLGIRARDLLLGGRRLARRSGPAVLRGHAARGARRRAPEGPAPDPHPLRPRRRRGRARAPLARPARLRPRARRAAPRRPRQARRHRRPPLRRRGGARAAVGRGRAGPGGEPARSSRAARPGSEAPSRVEYTPGHASHHVCYLHEPTGIAFVGDMAGVRVPPEPFTLAPTPPPDIDVEEWEALARDDRRLGAAGARAHPLRPRRRPGRSSSSGSARACTPRPTSPREHDETGFVEAYSARVHEQAGEAADAILQAAPPDQLFLGLERYLTKSGRVPSESMTETVELPRTRVPDPGSTTTGA